MLPRRCFPRRPNTSYPASPFLPQASCWTTCSSCAASRPCCNRLASSSTDASPFGGGCVAPVTAELWRTLNNLAEEQGEHVRFSWSSSPPPLELTPSRCACASLVTPANWSVLFGCQFRAPDHINVLELTALTSLVKNLAQAKNQPLLRRQQLLFLAAQLRPPTICIRVPQCVPVNRLVVGSISGETLPTHRRGAPRSPAGNVFSRRGHLKLQLFSSDQPLSPVSSNQAYELDGGYDDD